MNREDYEFIGFIEQGFDVFDYEAYLIEELNKARKENPELYDEPMIAEILADRTMAFEYELARYHDEIRRESEDYGR